MQTTLGVKTKVAGVEKALHLTLGLRSLGSSCIGSNLTVNCFSLSAFNIHSVASGLWVVTL